MIRKRECFSGHGRKGERGQALPMMIVWLIFVVAMLAVVADLGMVYVSYRQLQASTDAAALAAGQDLPNSVTSGAGANAALYSALPGGKNVYGELSGVSMPVTSGMAEDPLFYCSTTLSGLGLPCTSTSPALYNAVKVVQTATVPLNILNYFTSVLGAHPSIKIMAASTASGRVLSGGPYNVVVILDTTVSMQDADGDAANNPNCNGHSKIWCAMDSVQTFLSEITPCYTTPCSGSDTGGNYANPLNEVALMVFPGFEESPAANVISSLGTGLAGTYPWEVKDEFDWSPGTTPPIGSNQITASNISPYTQYSTATQMVEEYEIVPFSSDYWSLSATGAPAALNTSSNLVKAVYYPPYYSGAPSLGLAPPWGLADKGGEGTFYAGIITAAQEALVAEQTARSAAGVYGTQNVIILLSDGDATASASELNGGPPNGYSTSKECQQAVTAATAATNAGTIVYAVAYGAEGGGTVCQGDTLTPCQTMKDIASSPSQFFSDDTTSGSGTGCVGTAFTSSNLNQIFTFIANQFKTARLMPNGTP